MMTPDQLQKIKQGDIVATHDGLIIKVHKATVMTAWSDGELDTFESTIEIVSSNGIVYEFSMGDLRAPMEKEIQSHPFRLLRCPECGNKKIKEMQHESLITEIADIHIEEDGSVSVTTMDAEYIGRRNSVLRCTPCGYSWPLPNGLTVNYDD